MIFSTDTAPLLPIPGDRVCHHSDRQPLTLQALHKTADGQVWAEVNTGDRIPLELLAYYPVQGDRCEINLGRYWQLFKDPNERWAALGQIARHACHIHKLVAVKGDRGLLSCDLWLPLDCLVVVQRGDRILCRILLHSAAG